MLKICVLYPDLLGTYGDGGNALVLAQRAHARGIEVDVRSVTIGAAIPPASIYLLGGGEDGPQRLACDRSSASTRAGPSSRSAPGCRSWDRASPSRGTRRIPDWASSTP